MTVTVKTRGKARKCEAVLRSYAMGFPSVREDFPWGHSAFKVSGKTFLFMGSEDGGVSLSVKLPQSGPIALMQPFAEPTHYGLGKSGWVSARFAASEDAPIDDLKRWIDESYRAIAPKRLVAQLSGAGQAPPLKARRKTTKRRSA